MIPLLGLALHQIADMTYERISAVIHLGCAMFYFLPEDRINFCGMKCRLVAVLEEKLRCLEA